MTYCVGKQYAKPSDKGGLLCLLVVYVFFGLSAYCYEACEYPEIHNNDPVSRKEEGG